MKRQLVVVKDVEHSPFLGIVCDAIGSNVFVTSEKMFERIKNGGSGLYPIGFEAENVFVYEGQNLTAKIDWSKMKRWGGAK